MGVPWHEEHRQQRDNDLEHASREADRGARDRTSHRPNQLFAVLVDIRGDAEVAANSFQKRPNRLIQPHCHVFDREGVFTRRRRAR